MKNSKSKKFQEKEIIEDIKTIPYCGPLLARIAERLGIKSLVVFLIGVFSVAFLVYIGWYPEIAVSQKYKVLEHGVSHHILSPQAERLLSIIYKYQKDLGLNKLIIGRNGTLHFDEEEKREKYKVNVIGELFDVKSDYSSKEFESLMLSIPSNFLKFIPETRADSPYVVQVTKEGIAYLKGSAK